MNRIIPKVKRIQILVEFHHRFITNSINKTLDTIKLLNGYGFEVFAISNSLEEISLIRKVFYNTNCMD